jgi:hypothetical protein
MNKLERSKSLDKLFVAAEAENRKNGTVKFQANLLSPR